jgi:hypothetical protein
LGFSIHRPAGGEVDLSSASEQIRSAIEISFESRTSARIAFYPGSLDNGLKILKLLIEYRILLNKTDIVSALQDIQKLAQAFANYGIQ